MGCMPAAHPAGPMQCINRMPAVVTPYGLVGEGSIMHVAMSFSRQATRSVVALQVRRLAAVLLTMRLAVLPAEAAAPLKLLEKGVSKEALAGLVRCSRLGFCTGRLYKGSASVRRRSQDC